MATTIRPFAAALAVGAALVAGVALGVAGPAPRDVGVTVYKSPTCGCCAKWVDHLREHGFEVTVQDTADLGPVKATHGVPDALRACHTAVAGGYLIEGHVPADVIDDVLTERPEIVGVAVPGMPAGSPGMEGGRKVPYDIVAWDRVGATRVFARR